MSGPELSEETKQHVAEHAEAHRKHEQMQRAFDAGDYVTARAVAEDIWTDLDASVRGLIGYSRIADYDEAK